MFDLSVYKQRYFEVKLNNSLTIHIEMPTKKQHKNILSLTENMKDGKISGEELDKFYSAIVIALNKNKEKKKIEANDIEENFNLTALYGFFDEYYTWVSDNLNQKN